MFLCVVVTKGAQFDQFVWPRKLRSQVTIYNIDFCRVFPDLLKKHLQLAIFVFIIVCLIVCSALVVDIVIFIPPQPQYGDRIISIEFIDKQTNRFNR